jgi:hypothetical protein
MSGERPDERTSSHSPEGAPANDWGSVAPSQWFWPVLLIVTDRSEFAQTSRAPDSHRSDRARDQSEQHLVVPLGHASEIPVSKSRVSKIFEYRFPGWLAVAVILIVILGIKLITS